MKMPCIGLGNLLNRDMLQLSTILGLCMLTAKGYRRIIKKPYICLRNLLNRDMLQLSMILGLCIIMAEEYHKTTNSLMLGLA